MRRVLSIKLRLYRRFEKYYDNFDVQDNNNFFIYKVYLFESHTIDKPFKLK